MKKLLTLIFLSLFYLLPKMSAQDFTCEQGFRRGSDDAQHYINSYTTNQPSSFYSNVGHTYVPPHYVINFLGQTYIVSNPGWCQPVYMPAGTIRVWADQYAANAAVEYQLYLINLISSTSNSVTAAYYSCQLDGFTITLALAGLL